MHARASCPCDARRLSLSDRPRCRSNSPTASMSSILKRDQLWGASLLLVAGTTLRDLLCPLLHRPGRPAGCRAHRSSDSRSCAACTLQHQQQQVAKCRIAHLGFRLSFFAPRARGARFAALLRRAGRRKRGGVWLADPAVSVEPRHGAVDAGGKGLALCLLRPSFPHPLHAAIPPMLHLVTLPRARRCRAAQTHQIACMSGTLG